MATQTKDLFTKHQLKYKTTKTTSGSEVVSYYSDLGPDSTIMTMFHGYPQSAYMWRHMVPHWKEKFSLFVPELPGYGVSTPANQHTKKVVGGALLEALQDCFGITSSHKRRVIICGHDRGARITHRLVVDKDDYPNLDISAAVMIDIIPTQRQWQNFSDPVIASGYFHWPLLANEPLATDMLMAFGGGKWATTQINRIIGDNEQGRQRIHSDNAMKVYSELFEKRDTIRYSCLDYKEGSVNESLAQLDDQKQGRKIEVPALVLFSKRNLGARQDVEGIWREWIKPGVLYQGVGIRDGYGHHLPEEAPQECTDLMVEFMKKIT